jgi:hypothetical protein
VLVEDPRFDGGDICRRALRNHRPQFDSGQNRSSDVKLERDRFDGIPARLIADDDRHDALTGAEQHGVHLHRLRNEIAIPPDHIERHAVNRDLEKSVRANVRQFPELWLAKSNRNIRLDHAVDRYEFLIVRLADGVMFDEKNALPEVLDERIDPIAAFDDEGAREPPDDLSIDITV